MKRRKMTPADFRAMNAVTAGPVVMRFPADGGRPRLTVPDQPSSRRQRRGK